MSLTIAEKVVAGALFYIPVDLVLYRVGFKMWGVIVLSIMLFIGVVMIAENVREG